MSIWGKGRLAMQPNALITRQRTLARMLTEAIDANVDPDEIIDLADQLAEAVTALEEMERLGKFPTTPRVV